MYSTEDNDHLNSKDFFASRNNGLSFLESAQGEKFKSSFEKIRIEHILCESNNANFKILMEENIIPKKWIVEAQNFNHLVSENLKFQKIECYAYIYKKKLNNELLVNSFLGHQYCEIQNFTKSATDAALLLMSALGKEKFSELKPFRKCFLTFLSSSRIESCASPLRGRTCLVTVGIIQTSKLQQSKK